MKFGARIVKTGLAITVALVFAALLDIEAPVFAGISAVFAVQPSIYRSFVTMVDQIKSNIIGAVIATGLALLAGNSPPMVGIAAILTAMVTIQLKMSKNVSVALVTVVAIMEGPPEAFVSFAIMRFGSTLIGILSAFFVNLMFMPPKYEVRLFNHIHCFTRDMLKTLRAYINEEMKNKEVQHHLNKSRKPKKNIHEMYTLYKEEANYSRQNLMEKTRKVVLFKNLIHTASLVHQLLKKLNHLENERYQLPVHIQSIIKEDVNALINYHEELMNKSTLKIDVDKESESGIALVSIREKLIQSYVRIPLQNWDEEMEKNWIHMLPVISTMLELGEQLEHLDQLIHSFHTYHKEDTFKETSEEIEISLQNV